jgi:hypothetical protein
LLREGILTRAAQGGEGAVVTVLRRESLRLGGVAYLRPYQTHVCPLSERVGDLSDLIDMIDKRPELLLGDVACYIDLILDFI